MSVLSDFEKALGGPVTSVVIFGDSLLVTPRPATPCPDEHDFVPIRHGEGGVAVVCRACKRTPLEIMAGWTVAR
mgnify:CR=1 FL=1